MPRFEADASPGLAKPRHPRLEEMAHSTEVFLAGTAAGVTAVRVIGCRCSGWSSKGVVRDPVSAPRWRRRSSLPVASRAKLRSAQEQPCVFEESLRMLGLCGVARIRVHDELSIRKMLGEKECVDWHHDDVLAPVDDQCRVVDLAQHRET